MDSLIRVGAVSYLNARPLYEGLDGMTSGIRLELDHPSRLSARLEAGDLDIGLIPSVEHLRFSRLGFRVIRDLAIASSGGVRSVKLFSRVALESIARLALDAGSRTSQALCRIWLGDRYGVFPDRIEEHPLGIPIEESLADAVLLIGDRAMKVDPSPYHTTVDMADAWRELTGLPFVFAVWSVRPGLELGDLPQALRLCRDSGLARAWEIAEREAPRLGLSISACHAYLTRSLSYNLGESELAGLSEFARRAERHGLIPGGSHIVFHDDRVDLACRN